MAKLLKVFGQEFNQEGDPASAGTIRVYNHDTLVLADIYTDPEGSIAALNPFPLNADGRGDVYLGSGFYDAELRASDGTLLDVSYGIPGDVGFGSGTVTTVGTIDEVRAAPAGVSNYIEPTGYYVAGDGKAFKRYYWDPTSSAVDNGATVLKPLSDPATGRWIAILDGIAPTLYNFGARGDGVTNDYAALVTALTVTKRLHIPKGVFIITGTVITLASVENQRERIHITGEGVGQSFLYVQNFNGFLFRIQQRSSLQYFTLEHLTIDARNGANGASNLFLGLFQADTKDNRGFRFKNLIINGSDNPAARGIDLTYMFNCFLEDVLISRFWQGYGLYCRVTGLPAFEGNTTTISISRSYITYCREGFYFANAGTITFDQQSVIESCTVAGSSFNTLVFFNGCHFEDIGYEGTGAHGQQGLTDKRMEGHTAFAAGVKVNCGFNSMYGSMVFINCQFTTLHGKNADGNGLFGTLDFYFQGIGTSGGNAASGGSMTFIAPRCTQYNGQTNGLGKIFSTQEKGSFKYIVQETLQGSSQNAQLTLNIDEKRKIDSGTVMNGGLLCDVREGKFIAHHDSFPPPFGDWNVNDELHLRTRSAEGFDRYVCTVATVGGGGGTWEGFVNNNRRLIAAASGTTPEINSSIRMLQTINNNTNIAEFISYQDSSATGRPIIYLVRNRGTAAARTNILNNDRLGSLEFMSFINADLGATQGVVLQGRATQNWGTSAAGSVLEILATRNNGPLLNSAQFRGDSVLLNTLHLEGGANRSIGTAVLVAGSVTVANTLVTTNSIIMLTRQTIGGTVGELSVGSRVNGVSFVISSSNAADTSTVGYIIVESGTF